MSIFNDMLKNNETLFKLDVALDFSYVPKLMYYREKEQRQVASCIAPLFARRDGRNIFVYGKPGLGKTLAIRKVLEEVDENPEKDADIVTVYINCWQKNTSYKIILEICEALGYRFTQNKKTEELFAVIEKLLNKDSCVFCFDEVDKLEEMDFIYTILERIYRKSIVLITNSKEWLLSVEDRIRSRLAPDILEFRTYSETEVDGIIRQRAELAFQKGVLDPEALAFVVKRTCEAGDIRSGLHMLREAGNLAESQSRKLIGLEDVKAASVKLDLIMVNKPDELESEDRFILGIIKDSSGKRIGEVYQLYQNAGGKDSYKTFQRKIAKLAEGKFITAKKITGGPEGTTTILHYLRTKKITEFA